MSSLVEVREVVGATELAFHCSTCSQANSTDVFRFRTVDKWLGLIPIWVTYETTLKCPNCDTTYRCNDELEMLAMLSPEEVGQRFHIRVGFVTKFLVVAGWLLCFTGPVALILLIVAWFQLPKTPNWWRSATKYGFIMPFAFYPIVLIAAGVCDLLFN